MTKIKELFARLKKALGSAPKSGQGKAFVRVIQFFAVMLVLTIFARGASGATMPRVTSSSPHGAEIINSIDTTGTVSAQGTIDIELPAGLTVKRIVTGSGSTVKEGATLVEFDTEALEDKIEDEKLALRNLELELRELQLPGEKDKTVENAQKAVDKAQKSYDEAADEARKAGDALNAANDRHNENLAALDAAGEAYNEENDKPEEERDAEKLAALKEALDAAYDAQELSWLDVEGAVTAHEMAKTAKDGQAELLSDAQEALGEARETAAKNAQTQAITDERNVINIEKKQAEIEKQEELIKTLQSAGGAGGSVVATADGVVGQLPFEEGEETGEKAVIRITTADEGYTVECMVSQKEAGEIKVGDTLSVKRSGFYYASDAPVISKTMPNAEGMVTIKASLPGDDWNAGDSLEVQVVTKRQQYSYCVPPSAVHSDGNGEYVFVLREENTILGEQTVARRVDVTVQAQDKTNVAIEGAIYGESILISSTKPVSEGDRVRIEGSAES